MRTMSFLAVLLVWTMQACNNPRNQDSVSLAKDANKENDQLHADTPMVGMDVFDNSSNTHQDADFAVDAADGGMLEVELGKIAISKAQNQAVKDFGQRMVDDHTKINNELKALADQKGIVLPPAPSRDNADVLRKMNEKDANDFDKDFIDHMISDHNKDISLFEKASKDANDEEIRAFANRNLATLRSHKDAAEALKDRL